MAKKIIKSKPAKAVVKKTDNTIKVSVLEESSSSNSEVLVEDVKIIELQSQKSSNQEFLHDKISTENKEDQKQEEKESFNLDMKTKEYSYDESCCLDNQCKVEVTQKSTWDRIKNTIKGWFN